MPHFRIETNVSAEKVPKGFVKETTGIMAKVLGKPEIYCVASIVPDTSMCWGGTDDPCATATLMSIGQLGVKENKKIAKVLFEHVQKNLGISTDRMYISFSDADASNVGYKSTTFHEIFGAK